MKPDVNALVTVDKPVEGDLTSVENVNALTYQT
jgi:hypothetical protein